MALVSKEDRLEDQVKKLLGLPPYNSPVNFCYMDGYFSHALKSEFGEKAVADMIAKLQKGK